LVPERLTLLKVCSQMPPGGSDLIAGLSISDSRQDRAARKASRARLGAMSKLLIILILLVGGYYGGVAWIWL